MNGGDGASRAVEAVVPGIFRIEVPLPRSPLRSVNAWAIPDGAGGGLLVDTGMRRPECRAPLFAGLERLGMTPGRVRVVVTHLHADHSGLAGDLAAEGAEVLMGARERRLLARFGSADRFLDLLRDQAVRLGLPQDGIEDTVRRHPGVRYGPPEDLAAIPLEAGDTIAAGPYRFEVVEVPGHTPGHVCLWEPRHRLLLAGDHVLGDITPNITAWPGVPDSLGDYLESLERVRRLDPALILPGHRSPVHRPAERIDALVRHHEARLEEVLRILDAGPATVYEVASRMTWDIRADSWSAFPPAQRWFACGEAASHLDRLAALGLATAEGDRPALWRRRR